MGAYHFPEKMAQPQQQQQAPDFAAEYSDFVSGLGEAGMAFYKFLDLWAVKISDEEYTATIRFGKKIEDDDVPKEVAAALRKWLKEQKQWIRKEQKSAPFAEIRRRLWFLGAKMLEQGWFEDREQKTILVWLDMCLDRAALPQQQQLMR